jgi:hypothetical protein
MSDRYQPGTRIRQPRDRDGISPVFTKRVTLLTLIPRKRDDALILFKGRISALKSVVVMEFPFNGKVENISEWPPLYVTGGHPPQGPIFGVARTRTRAV